MSQEEHPPGERHTSILLRHDVRDSPRNSTITPFGVRLAALSQGVLPGLSPLVVVLRQARKATAPPAVVVGAWLAAGERAVWTLVTHIWRSLVLPVMPLATPEAPSAAAVPSVVETMLLRLWVGSVGRRGPPHLLAI